MAINPLSPTAVQQAMFKRADSNKSGKLDSAEFAKALTQAQGKPVSEAQAKAALKQLDSDGDGAVNVSEFEKANVAAAQSAASAKPNLYQALQTAGIAQANSDSYTSLLQGSLNGTFNATGALVGQIVGGAITNKIA